MIIIIVLGALLLIGIGIILYVVRKRHYVVQAGNGGIAIKSKHGYQELGL